jgi:hypothetical protein
MFCCIPGRCWELRWKAGECEARWELRWKGTLVLRPCFEAISRHRTVLGIYDKVRLTITCRRRD